MHEKVDIPHSKMKERIAEILKEQGYISNFKIVTDEGNKKNIRVYLKYAGKERVIKGLKRISKPGRRVYSSVEDMPRVLSGLGIAIVSTSKGVKKKGIPTRGDASGGVGRNNWRSGPKSRRSERDSQQAAQAAPAEHRVLEVHVPETISVAELAHKMAVKDYEIGRASCRERV